MLCLTFIGSPIILSNSVPVVSYVFGPVNSTYLY